MAFSNIINSGFIDITKNNALINIKKERENYKNIYKNIEKYCIDNKLFLSNKYVLVDKQEDVNNICKLYTYKPLEHANALVNFIYKKNINDDNIKYTRLKTIVENEEFVIEYNFRNIIYIYKLQKYKGVEPYNIIRAEKIHWLCSLNSFL